MTSPTIGSKITSSNSERSGKRTLSDVLIGPPRDVRDPEIFHSLSLIAFLAWVGLGSDGLSSSCYGPEEAFLALGHHQIPGSVPRDADGADRLHYLGVVLA